MKLYIAQLESDIPKSRYDDDVRGVNVRSGYGSRASAAREFHSRATIFHHGWNLAFAN